MAASGERTEVHSACEQQFFVFLAALFARRRACAFLYWFDQLKTISGLASTVSVAIADARASIASAVLYGFLGRGVTDFTGYNAEMLSLWSEKCGAFWPCLSR